MINMMAHQIRIARVSNDLAFFAALAGETVLSDHFLRQYARYDVRGTRIWQLSRHKGYF